MTQQEILKNRVLNREIEYSTCKGCGKEIGLREPHNFAKAEVPFTDGPYHTACCPPFPVSPITQ